MLISQAKRRENIAEYLLYMWQVEDMIRACDVNIETIKERIISAYDVDDDTRRQITDWWEGLTMMMKSENKREGGHLQINTNVIIRLNDLHQALLHSDKYPDYGALFYRTLPFIVELRAKTPEASRTGEIETCFNALYGMLMMRLQGKPVSKDTEVAMSQISQFIATLAAYFKKDEEKPLFES